MIKKTFVLRCLGLERGVPNYCLNGDSVLCGGFVKKQLHDMPKYLAVTVSNKRFLGSKRIFVNKTFCLWRWGTPSSINYDGGTHDVAMETLVKHGIINYMAGFQVIYFKLSPLLTSFKKKV